MSERHADDTVSALATNAQRAELGGILAPVFRDAAVRATKERARQGKADRKFKVYDPSTGEVTGEISNAELLEGLARRAGVEFDVENTRPTMVVCRACGLPIKVQKVGKIPTACPRGKCRRCRDCGSIGDKVSLKKQRCKNCQHEGRVTAVSRMPLAKATSRSRKCSEASRQWNRSLTADERSDRARARNASRTAEERSASAQKAHASLTEEQLRARARLCGESAREFQRTMSPEQRRDRARNAALSRSVMTVEKVREIRRKHARGAAIGSLAALFGVKYAVVYAVVTRRTWADVT